MITKFFCDLCNAEVAKQDDLNYAQLSFKKGGGESAIALWTVQEACVACREKARITAYSLLERFKAAFPPPNVPEDRD